MSLPLVYETDRRSAAICHVMQVTGFGYDYKRAARFVDELKTQEAAAAENLAKLVGQPVNPNSPAQLQDAFMGVLGAPIYFRSALTGKPSFGKDTMRGYAAVVGNERLREAALAVLALRRLKRVRVNYIERIVYEPDPTGFMRVHPGWQNFGAVSGRWSCQGPNLMNLPRAENDPLAALGGIRSLYYAPPNYTLWSFDAKQLEMRIAAYASGDDAMIAACEAGDLHAGNAAVIFGDSFDMAAYRELDAKKNRTEDENKLYGSLAALRSLAKSAGFAVCYGANAATVYARIVAEGKQVTVRQVEAMLARMKRAFRAYYAWQNRQLMQTVKLGYIATPLLGRRRWLGHDPSPTECMNFPIQGGAADLMNIRVPEILDAVQAAGLRARLVAQVHDSVVFEAHQDDVAALRETAIGTFVKPMVFESSGRAIPASFPVDEKQAERWS